MGASTNPSRFSYMAVSRLKQRGYEFVPVGIKKGEVGGTMILDIRHRPVIPDVHTITLYMNPHTQEAYQDYILSLNPGRIIFNPGTENEVLADRARSLGIETVYDCTLVMLGSGTY